MLLADDARRPLGEGMQPPRVDEGEPITVLVLLLQGELPDGEVGTPGTGAVCTRSKPIRDTRTGLQIPSIPASSRVGCNPPVMHTFSCTRRTARTGKELLLRCDPGDGPAPGGKGRGGGVFSTIGRRAERRRGEHGAARPRHAVFVRGPTANFHESAPSGHAASS